MLFHGFPMPTNTRVAAHLTYAHWTGTDYVYFQEWAYVTDKQGTPVGPFCT